jgi:hypothetical protein
MGLFLRILLGVVLAGIGAFMVIRTSRMVEWFGAVEWAEAKLGGGGTRLFYKLLGIVLCFVGFMVATNLWNAFLEGTLGRVFPTGEQPTQTTRSIDEAGEPIYVDDAAEY